MLIKVSSDSCEALGADLLVWHLCSPSTSLSFAILFANSVQRFYLIGKKFQYLFCPAGVESWSNLLFVSTWQMLSLVITFSGRCKPHLNLSTLLAALLLEARGSGPNVIREDADTEEQENSK